MSAHVDLLCIGGASSKATLALSSALALLAAAAVGEAIASSERLGSGGGAARREEVPGVISGVAGGGVRGEARGGVATVRPWEGVAAAEGMAGVM